MGVVMARADAAASARAVSASAGVLDWPESLEPLLEDRAEGLWSSNVTMPYMLIDAHAHLFWIFG